MEKKEKKIHPLAKWRKRHNLTQKDLAAAPDISVNYMTIWRIETGRSYPERSLLMRLCQKTGLSADVFINFTS